MTHKHHFVASAPIEKSISGGRSIHATTQGTAYVCIDPECGEVRNVYSDGQVLVAKSGLEELE